MLPMERWTRFVPDSRHAELWAETLFHEALTLPDPRQRQKQVRDAALIGMRACKILGGWRNWAIFWVHGKWTGLVAKLVWRVKLVAEVRPGMETETEVGRIERDEDAGLADLGLQLAEMKQLAAALQAEIVPAQVSVLGERCRFCVACGGMLASKGYYPATLPTPRVASTASRSSAMARRSRRRRSREHWPRPV